jgi:hypothetical protein
LQGGFVVLEACRGISDGVVEARVVIARRGISVRSMVVSSQRDRDINKGHKIEKMPTQKKRKPRSRMHST